MELCKGKVVNWDEQKFIYQNLCFSHVLTRKLVIKQAASQELMKYLDSSFVIQKLHKTNKYRVFLSAFSLTTGQNSCQLTNLIDRVAEGFSILRMMRRLLYSQNKHGFQREGPEAEFSQDKIDLLQCPRSQTHKQLFTRCL